jgi:hypothetical protein
MTVNFKKMSVQQLLGVCASKGWNLPGCRQLTRRELVDALTKDKAPPGCEPVKEAAKPAKAKAERKSYPDLEKAKDKDGNVTIGKPIPGTEPEPDSSAVDSGDEDEDDDEDDEDEDDGEERAPRRPLSASDNRLTRAFLAIRHLDMAAYQNGTDTVEQNIAWAYEDEYVGAIFGLKGKEHKNVLYVTAQKPEVMDAALAEMAKVGIKFSKEVSEDHEGDYLLVRVTVNPDTLWDETGDDEDEDEDDGEDMVLKQAELNRQVAELQAKTKPTKTWTKKVGGASA